MNTLQLNKKGVNGRTLNVVGLDGRSVSFPLRKPDSEPTSPYIKFADPEVKRICVENWGSDGEITYEQAAAVTGIGQAFKGNTVITTFDEFKYFTGVAEVATSAFEGCTSLDSITFPANLTTIDDLAFKLCSFENENLVLDNITFIKEGAFNNTKLRSVVMPEIGSVGGAYSDGYTTFGFCPNLEYLFFGKDIRDISPYILKRSNESVVMIVAATTPPAFIGDSFDYSGAPAAIYVPEASLEAYKTATNWSRYAAKLFSIEDDMPTKHADIYEEIKDYL